MVPTEAPLLTTRPFKPENSNFPMSAAKTCLLSPIKLEKNHQLWTSKEFREVRKTLWKFVPCQWLETDLQ
jgi:hypothetical protein